MSRGLTLEQMAFLVSKGVTAEEMLSFAQMGHAQSKAAARTARWRAKKAGTVTESVTCDVTGDASPPPNDIYSNPPFSSDEENIGPKTRKGAIAKPEDVSEQVWTDYLAQRKAKKSPVSETVVAGIRREAEKAGWSLDAALAECVTRGWQGFKADWVKDAAKPQAPPGANPLLKSLMAKQAPPT